jgi:hypothetical protein
MVGMVWYGGELGGRYVAVDSSELGELELGESWLGVLWRCGESLLCPGLKHRRVAEDACDWLAGGLINRETSPVHSY